MPKLEGQTSSRNIIMEGFGVRVGVPNPSIPTFAGVSPGAPSSGRWTGNSIARKSIVTLKDKDNMSKSKTSAVCDDTAALNSAIKELTISSSTESGKSKKSATAKGRCSRRLQIDH